MEKYKNDLSSYNSTLTLLDENAQTIMGQIKEEKFEEIKRDYNIVFEGLEDFSFPIKLFSSESPFLFLILTLNSRKSQISFILWIQITVNGIDLD